MRRIVAAVTGAHAGWRRRARWISVIALPAVLATNVWSLADGWGNEPDPEPVTHRHFASTSEPIDTKPDEPAPPFDVSAELALTPMPPRLPLPAERPARVAF